MGTNNLTDIGTITPIRATGDLFDQFGQALKEDFVPRNSSGVPTTAGGSLGTSDYQWSNIRFSGNLVSSGETLDLGSLGTKQYSISDGAKKTSGYPQFLATHTNSTSVLISTNTGSNPLSLIINNNELTISSDTSYTGMTTAPSSNNTCLINKAEYAGEELTKMVGESPWRSKSIPIDTIGTEIGSLGGTIQCFEINNGTSTELAIAYVDVANSLLYPFMRGIGETDRLAITNNNTVTLKSANYLFLENEGSTKHATTTFPTFRDSEPASAASGDWYFSTNTNVWNRYNGASWDAKSAIFLGLAVCSDSIVVAVEPNDFNVGFRQDISTRCVYIDADTVLVLINNIYVADNQIKTEKQRGIYILLSEEDDRESGVSEAASTTYYIYIKEDGQPIYSDKPPRSIDHRLGAYHPYQYWRCVGKIFNDSSSNIADFQVQLNESFYTERTHKVIIDIGSLNVKDMGNGGTANVAHGLGTESMKIRSAHVVIRNDSNNKIILPDAKMSVTTNSGIGDFYYQPLSILEIDTTNIILMRTTLTGGVYDSRSDGLYDDEFDNATNYNRGWVVLELEN